MNRTIARSLGMLSTLTVLLGGGASTFAYYSPGNTDGIAADHEGDAGTAPAIWRIFVLTASRCGKKAVATSLPQSIVCDRVVCAYRA
jgi:hypothetical protein